MLPCRHHRSILIHHIDVGFFFSIPIFKYGSNLDESWPESYVTEALGLKNHEKFPACMQNVQYCPKYGTKS